MVDSDKSKHSRHMIRPKMMVMTVARWRLFQSVHADTKIERWKEVVLANGTVTDCEW